MPKGSEIIASAISSTGVGYVFSLPDGMLLPIYELLEKRGVRTVIMRHETTAAQAADGYARYSRLPGFVLAPVGPGASYLMPGLAQAYYAGSPVIAIGGRTSLKFKDMDAFEEADTYRWMEHYTKFSQQCIDACHLDRCLREAIQSSLTGRMAPSYIEVARDVTQMECNKVRETYYSDPGRPEGDPEKIQEIVKLLNSSRKPVIIAGSGVHWSNACKELTTLASRTHIPVLLESFSLGCIPHDHPAYAGQAPLGLVTSEADLVFYIGAKPDELLGFGINPAMYNPERKIIQVDIDPRVLGRNIIPDVTVWGDAKAVLRQIIQHLEKENFDKKTEWMNQARSMFLQILEAGASVAEESVPMKPQYVVKTVWEVFGRDAYYVLDGGDTTGWGYMYLQAYEPLQVAWAHGPFGGIGSGIPVAIGAKLARPDKHIVLITGDGSYLMGSLEIDTASRYCIPLTIVILDDRAWGDVYHNWILTHGESETAKRALLHERDYHKIAEALGGKGYQVKDPRELKQVLLEIKQSKDCSPTVVDAIISQEEISPISQVLLRER